MSDKRKGFWAGAFMLSAFHSLFQDWLGLEGYVEFAQRCWVSGAFTVPLALALLGISIALLTHVVTKPKDED